MRVLTSMYHSLPAQVMGLPRKKNYHGRWDQLIAMCTRCLNTLLDMACKRRRNYIIDQVGGRSDMPMSEAGRREGGADVTARASGEGWTSTPFLPSN